MWNYYSYGFENVIGISSSHGYNIGELEERVTDFLKEKYDIDEEDYTDEEFNVRLALLGKPNTGKSTLNNLLTGKENSIVSDIPGTTRDIVEGGFCSQGFALSDYGYCRDPEKKTRLQIMLSIILFQGL